MKAWAKHGIFILIAGTAAVAVMTMRPALTPDFSTEAILSSEVELAEPASDMDVHYTVDLNNPKGQTRYIGDIEPTAYSLLQDTPWKVRFYTKDGKAVMEAEKLVPHAKKRLCLTRHSQNIDYRGSQKEKQPDGSYNTIYYFNLLSSVSVTPSFWQKECNTLSVQTFRVNPAQGEVDIVSPMVELEQIVGHQTRLYVHTPIDGLPARFGGDTKDIALGTFLYELGKIDNKEQAKYAGGSLTQLAAKILPKMTDPDKPWPECWGGSAAKARDCARKIVPTLLYLQQHECFGSKTLADFINSEDFARVFGSEFADKVKDPLDTPMESFPIEEVPAETLDGSADEETAE